MQSYFNASKAEKSALLRQQTILTQLKTNKVTDEQILAAFQHVPREIFIEGASKSYSYIDRSFEFEGVAETGEKRVMFEPMITARLLQAAKLKPTDSVLVLPGYYGYTAALIGQLCRNVISIDTIETVTAKARELMKTYRFDNHVAVATVNDLSVGYSAKAPFDGIFLEGVVPELPENLLHQLRDGGCLMAMVGDPTLAVVQVVRRQGQSFTSIPLFESTAPMLSMFKANNSAFTL